ncbi:unnamed protein product [Echinostoma caproni]|uniref:WW domain-containing protein n=1 Tax=Echinostoma caproni TaxID=27848 RepID=A0A183AAL6_9TREM|nr:unnamed protein product [Echinostoma caproni]
MGKLKMSTADSPTDWTPSELSEVNEVWRKLKPAEDWLELMEDPIQWKSSNITDKGVFDADRIALKSLQNST